MRNLRYVLATGAAALTLLLTNTNLSAQERRDRGNFDPEQMRQRMMERYRETLEVKNDDEWKVIEGRITKVMDARRDVGAGGGAGMFFGRRRGGDNNGGGAGDDERRRRFGGEPSPEADALQKAVEAKASNEELKAKLAKYREIQKEKQAKLDQAQNELRKVLSVRQEANAVLMGLLR